MDFSIILASRARSQLLIDFIRSIQDTTSDLSNIEVLVGIDDDDAETQGIISHITNSCSFARFFSRPRSHMLNRDYLNWVYNMAGSGRFVIVCNDDAAFRTKDWDKIALAKLDAYLTDKPDGIVYGYMSDALLNRQGMNYCCFPLVSRAGANCLGFVMPPQFPGWDADIIIWRIYSAVGRTCNISEVMIEHISYHSGTRERDQTSYHVEEISKGNHHVPIEGCIQQLTHSINISAVPMM